MNEFLHTIKKAGCEPAEVRELMLQTTLQVSTCQYPNTKKYPIREPEPLLSEREKLIFDWIDWLKGNSNVRLLEELTGHHHETCRRIVLRLKARGLLYIGPPRRMKRKGRPIRPLYANTQKLAAMEKARSVPKCPTGETVRMSHQMTDCEVRPQENRIKTCVPKCQTEKTPAIPHEKPDTAISDGLPDSTAINKENARREDIRHDSNILKHKVNRTYGVCENRKELNREIESLIDFAQTRFYTEPIIKHFAIRHVKDAIGFRPEKESPEDTIRLIKRALQLYAAYYNRDIYSSPPTWQSFIGGRGKGPNYWRKHLELTPDLEFIGDLGIPLDTYTEADNFVKLKNEIEALEETIDFMEPPEYRTECPESAKLKFLRYLFYRIQDKFSDNPEFQEALSYLEY